MLIFNDLQTIVKINGKMACHKDGNRADCFHESDSIMKSKKLTVRLPSEAASKLKIISAQTGRSVQDIIGQAVTEWLAKNGGEA